MWPPTKGYTFSFWFSVNTFVDEKTSLPNDICLFSLESSSRTSKIECYLTKNTVISIQLGNNEAFTFSDYVFQSNMWYHTTVTFVSQKNAKVSDFMVTINGNTL